MVVDTPRGVLRGGDEDVTWDCEDAAVDCVGAECAVTADVDVVWGAADEVYPFGVGVVDVGVCAC